MSTFSVPTKPIGMDRWVTNGVMTSEEALTFIEQMDSRVPYTITMRTARYQAYDEVTEITLDDLQHIVFEDQQEYCDVCGTSYHPEDPCLQH